MLYSSTNDDGGSMNSGVVPPPFQLTYGIKQHPVDTTRPSLAMQQRRRRMAIED